MKTMHLGHYTEGDRGWDINDTNGYTVTVYRALTDKEYGELRLQLADINFFESGTSLCGLMQSCFMDLVNSIEAVGHKYFAPKYTYDQLVQEVNSEVFKSLMNALAMFKSLRDHAEVSIQKKFGKGSTKHQAWLERQSAIYDRSAAYRLFHNLRNYCQHVGLPGMMIDIEGIPWEGVGFNSVMVKLMFDRSLLLNSYSKWSADARKDLQAASDDISLISYVNRWGHDICELINFYVEILREKVYESAVSILNLRLICGAGPKGRLGIFELTDSRIEQNVHASVIIPEGLCRMIYTGHEVYIKETVFIGDLSDDGVLTVHRDVEK